MIKTQNSNKNFTKEEVVWAKVRGYPAWPAIVKKIQEVSLDDGSKRTDITCTFIGDNTYSVLQSDKVYKYQQHYKQYSNQNKQKKLQNSIKQADQIIQGKMTYEETNSQYSSKKGSAKSQKNDYSDDDSSADSSSDQSHSYQQIKKQDQKRKNQLLKKSIAKKTTNQPSLAKNRRKLNGQMNRINIDSQSECSYTKNSSKQSARPPDFSNLEENQWQVTKKSNFPYNNDTNNSPKNTSTMLTTNLQLHKLTKDNKSINKNNNEDNMEEESKDTMTKYNSIPIAQSKPKESQIMLEQTFNKIMSFLVNNSPDKANIEISLNILLKQIKEFLELERKSTQNKEQIVDNPKYFSNIVEFVSNNNAININCIKDLLSEKSSYINAFGINVSYYIKELDKYVSQLKHSLTNYYFNHTEHIKEIRILHTSQPKIKKEVLKLQNKIQKKQMNTTEEDTSMSEEEEEQDNNSSHSNYSAKPKQKSTSGNKLMKMSNQNLIPVQQQQEADDIYHSEDEVDNQENNNSHNLNINNVTNKQNLNNNNTIKNQQKINNEENNNNSMEEEDQTKLIQKDNSNSLTQSPQTQTTVSNHHQQDNNNIQQKQNSHQNTQKSNITLTNSNNTNNVSQQNSNLTSQSSSSSQVANPQMRKKVCKKIMEKFIEIYQIEKKPAQDFVLSVEKFIRGIDPQMKKKYQDMVVVIMKIIKNKLMEEDKLIQLGKSQNIDFTQLEQILSKSSTAI